MPSETTERGPMWRWWVCGLLLLATTINYMDRQTLAQLIVTVEKELALDKDIDYGWIESLFGLAFALGSICFGFLVDRYNVYWVYPIALIGWSAAGFLTGYSEGFWSLLGLRVMLGFFEGANWPCALRTTQRILTPDKRAMGNGILQSGVSIGALLFPLVALLLVDQARPETWRLPFFVVGAAGTVWVVFWWASVRPADLALPVHTAEPSRSTAPAAPALPRDVFIRRFAVLIVLVVSINMTWHFLRAWHPKYLQEQCGFSESRAQWTSAGYYLCTDAGALTAGYLAMSFAAGGLPVHASRRRVFLGMALIATLAVAIPFAESTWLRVALLLLVGFGTLGMFPSYYSFSQDLTTRSQGKLTGTLGACCWGAMAVWQPAIGYTVKYTGSYTIPFLIAAVLPLTAFAVLYFYWGEVPQARPADPAPQTAEAATAAP